MTVQQIIFQKVFLYGSDFSFASKKFTYFFLVDACSTAKPAEKNHKYLSYVGLLTVKNVV